MSMHPSEPLHFVDEEASYGSGEDINMVDGNNKRQPETPLSSGRLKRNRKATCDAIVDAMLEIASASKSRAAALSRKRDQFSVSRCIKVLDDIQGVDQHVYFRALDLFENPNARETFLSLKNERRLAWLQRKCGNSTLI